MSEVKVEGVPLTYDKRKKGHKFSWQGMEIFFKGKDTEEERKKIEVQVKELLGENKNETTSSFAEGGMEDGGLKDEGGTVDPVSGNEVPSGSTQEEVRDDIPAQLSEGEFVFPADVVRYIGLENLMELRAKAKQGLAKMEAMGQMGNSDEATMEDDGEYESEIDDLIDNFDPNDPESMEFSQGGVVYAQQGAYMQGQPQQQFSYGFMPPQQQGFQAPGYSVMPSQTPFITSPARVAVGQAPVAPENRTYVGPDGTEIIVPFYDGKPMKGYVIPKGFKYKSPEEVVAETPEVAQPVVTQPSGGDGDDREREKAEAERIANEKELNNLLAKYDPEFAKVIAEDPFMTGKITNPYAALGATINTISSRTDAIPGVLAQFGLDAKEYENKGILGALPGNKYDINAIREDLKANDAIRELFGGDGDAAEEALQGTRVTAEGGLRDGKTTYTQGEAERRARARGAFDSTGPAPFTQEESQPPSSTVGTSFTQAATSGSYDDPAYAETESQDAPVDSGGGGYSGPGSDPSNDGATNSTGAGSTRGSDGWGE